MTDDADDDDKWWVGSGGGRDGTWDADLCVGAQMLCSEKPAALKQKRELELA